MTHKGLFITFEGGEGCGKTTVIRKLEARLKEKGIEVLVTREPGGSVIAEEIRNIILDKKNTAMDPRTEALLYAASRRQHLKEIVIPALEQDKIVISDRYLDSSLAYQGYARGIGIDKVYAINEFAIDETMPDITFFLDLEPEKGLERIALHRSDEVNRLDLENISFHHKVYDAYKILMEKYPDRIVRIDASRSVEEETAEILEILLKRIHK
jgi:dTMP kinase